MHLLCLFTMIFICIINLLCYSFFLFFDRLSLQIKHRYRGQLSNKYTYFSYSPHDSSYQPPYPIYTSLRSLLHFKRSVADQYRGDTISVKGPSTHIPSASVRTFLISGILWTLLNVSFSIVWSDLLTYQKLL